MASVFHGVSLNGHKCVLILGIGLATTVHQACGRCGSDDNKSSRSKQENGNCWYELWYFWLIVALVLITVIIVVFFYCKHSVKQNNGRRGRCLTPVVTMPPAPPLYEAPSHDPPNYDIAMATSIPATTSQKQLQREDTTLPGYVLESSEMAHYDNLSVISTISGALSNPPPYSPPHSAYTACRRPDDEVL